MTQWSALCVLSDIHKDTHTNNELNHLTTAYFLSDILWTLHCQAPLPRGQGGRCVRGGEWLGGFMTA
jgi:hypothetical protein